MGTNGRHSCTENSVFVIFLVKDHIDKVDVRVEYFPTNLMLEEIFLPNNNDFKIQSPLKNN